MYRETGKKTRKSFCGDRRLAVPRPFCQNAAMSSILDIDLDYFSLLESPVQNLEKLLAWACRPVDLVVGKHNRAVTRWKRLVQRGALLTPSHILHVDEHHDMMDGRETISISNCMRHAMLLWPECRVHWMVDTPIDSPEMWLSDEEWSQLRAKFSRSHRIPNGWPKPDFVSVCTSPDFLEGGLLERLLQVVTDFINRR